MVQKPSQEAKQTLAARAHQVAVSVQEIVHCSELIKGTDWVDPEDPTVIAESELLTAAKSIELPHRNCRNSNHAKRQRKQT